MAKLCQETHETWYTMLLIALLTIKVAPKGSLKLSPFEITYGRPFVTATLWFAEEPNQILKYIASLGKARVSPKVQK